MATRPRLGPKELDLWNDFIDSEFDIFSDYKFDILVIPESIAYKIKAEGDQYDKDWNFITSPRIDVVARDMIGNRVIFEVRPEADFTALASVLAYSEFMKVTGQIVLQPTLIVLCRTITNNTRHLAQLKGIKVIKMDHKEDPNQKQLYEFEDEKASQPDKTKSVATGPINGLPNLKGEKKNE